MKYIMLFLILVSLAYANASPEPLILNSNAQITFTTGAPYSCRILKHRISEAAKTDVGLQQHLDRLQKKSRWTTLDYQSLDSMMRRAEFTNLRSKVVDLKIIWPLTEASNEWAGILSGSDPLAIHWLFKWQDWKDANGIMPNNVQTQWLPEGGVFSLSLQISPLELCFSSEYLNLQITHLRTSQILNLTSFVYWP